MPKRFSSVVGRSFGDGVRAVIEATGMPQRRIAELLDFEQAKVSDLVNGKGGVTEVELAMLLGLCQAEPDEARRLLALYGETCEKGTTPVLRIRCAGTDPQPGRAGTPRQQDLRLVSSNGG